MKNVAGCSLYNIRYSGQTAKIFKLPKKLTYNDIIIAVSSFGGKCGAPLILAGYAIYYEAYTLHDSFTVPAPSISSVSTTNLIITNFEEIAVKVNSTNTFIDVEIIQGGIAIE